MTAQIIQGDQYAKQCLETLSKPIALLKTHDITPRLDVYLIGNDPASHIYVNRKKDRASEIGIDVKTFHLSEDISELDLLTKIERSNLNPEVHGVLVQLPLPKHINQKHVLNAIQPKKDVDGFHAYNFGQLWSNPKRVYMNGNMSCTAHACLELIKTVEPDLTGKDIVIIGATFIVGKPLAGLLLHEKATVTMTHIDTENLKDKVKQADIIVSATGKAKLVQSDWVHPDAIIIDVGISRLGDEIVGDADFQALQDKCRAITPVPGGVGPVTIANLLRNIIFAAANQMQIDIHEGI